MTTGIYLLIFDTGDTYVGQARNIEDRYDQHINNMRQGKAAAKMQIAYDASANLPDIDILIECHEDYLNAMEMYYITVRQPTLNTVIPKTRPEDEINTLIKNKEILIHPPAVIINNLVTALLDNKELTEEVTNFRNDPRIFKAIARDKLNEKINKLMKRNLWQRIFNHPV